MALPKLTNDIITAAIEGFEAQKRRIDARIAELRKNVSGSQADASSSTGTRRKMSAAGRRAIAAAQRKRWAETRGQSELKSAVTKRQKRRLSAAGRAAIIAALKKRWAAKKAVSKK